MSALAPVLASEIPRRFTLKWLLGALRYAFIRVRTRLLLEAAISRLPQALPAIPVHYRFGDVSDIDRLSMVDPEYDEPAKRAARQRLAAGAQLVIGEYEGQPVFSVWIMLGAIEAGSRRRPMPVSLTRAYSYKLHTAEAYRGRGVASGVYRFIAPMLAARGCTRLVCWISDRNTASVRMHLRSGFVPLATIYEIRLFGFWTLHWWGWNLRRRLRTG